MKQIPFTQDQLREMFDYDQNIGLLICKKRLGSRSIVGAEVGWEDGGYKNVKLAGKNYRQHRVIWKWMTGKDPENKIDHKDTNRLNNKWNNLREASNEQNGFNKPLQVNNTSGIKGLSIDQNGYYYCQVSAYGISKQNRFADLDLAIEWLDKTRKQLHQQYANNGN